MGNLFYPFWPMQYRRFYLPGGTFFFTIVTNQHQPLLVGERAITLLRESFQTVMQRHPFEMDAYVILPDHLHTIWRLPPGDSNYSNRWRLIKSHFSHHFVTSLPNSPSRMAKGERPIWQRRFWEHTIRDEQDYENHLHYIHYNPVKHSLAAAPADWPYSSFRSWVDQGVYTVDWAAPCELFSPWDRDSQVGLSDVTR